jgi:RNA polymerase sigma-70 factor, ECF subfamily
MAAGEFDDPAFLALLRRGDSRAYDRLVRRYHATLVGVATTVIGSRAQAEEVVQDTWIAVLGAIGAFEGRSSLSTWLFSIVMNRARTRVVREGRVVGLPAGLDGSTGEERAVPAGAFKPDGHWETTPRLWDELDPERVIAGRQLWEHVLAGLETLPAGQKAVLVLRDMEGQSAEEACALLDISPENQRVLLHRARGRIRKLIDDITAPRPGGALRGAAVRLGVLLAGLAHGVAQVLANLGLATLMHQICAAPAGPWRSLASRAQASAR